MRWFRYAADLVAASVFASLIAGFLMGFLLVLIVGGPGAVFTPAALAAALVGAVYAALWAGPAALVLGGLLWSLRLRGAMIWAGTGALTGLLYCIFLWRSADGREPTWIFPLALAHVLAGACAALCFRSAMRTLRDEDETRPA